MTSRRIMTLLFILTAALAQAQTATTTVPERYTNDATPDFEPTIFNGTSAVATTGTVTVSIKSLSATSFRNHYVSKVGSTTGNGDLPLPPNTANSYDPYLYANLWNTTVAPYRLYCVGLASDPAVGVTSNRVTVWRTDNLAVDGFASFAPVIVDQGGPSFPVPNDTTVYEERTLDKPTIVVNGYGSHRGAVFVSYMRQSKIRRFSDNGTVKTYHSIYVAKSTDGGATWSAPSLVYSTENELNPVPINGAHITTANGTGYVYVAWVRYSLNATRGGITLARSPGAGTITGSWVIDTTGPSGMMSTDVMNNEMKEISVVIMRHHAAANKLMLVWNEPDGSRPDSTHDVYYAEKGGSGWSTWNGVNKLKVSTDQGPCNVGTNPETSTDQLRPTIDYDSNGKITIVYYDRKQSCTNDPYNASFVRLTTGTSTAATVVQAPTSFADLLGSSASDLTNNGGRVGEYFDIWCVSATCHVAWIGTPKISSTNTTRQGDVLVTKIQ
jgi:hypothetical protein